MAANAWDDWTLRGLGPALAPLFNDGTLDGIDLHTYYDVQWAPMENGFSNSAMHNFLMVKRASGITADIEFYATEWNYKFRECTREQAAAGVFTGLFDHLGVVGNDGKTPVARIAFPWNVFQNSEKVKQFGMSESSDPYKPSPRGATLQRALALVGDLRIAASDPLGTGMMALAGEDRTVWVWQNRRGWTDRPGTEITLHGVPLNIKEVEVHGWDGERKRVTAGKETLTITGLPEGETLLFVACARATAEGAALLPPDAYTMRPELVQEKNEVEQVKGATLLQETFDAKQVKQWNVGPSSDVEAEVIKPEAVEATGAAGRCVKFGYAFVKDEKNVVPDTWRFASSQFTGKVRMPADCSPVITFKIRCTQPGRNVRLMVHDKDGETFISGPEPCGPAWKQVVLTLDGDKAKHWGGKPANGKLDWPLRLFSLEFLNWGGASANVPEYIWIDDLRVIAREEKK